MKLDQVEKTQSIDPYLVDKSVDFIRVYARPDTSWEGRGYSIRTTSEKDLKLLTPYVINL
jgi:hypothetical protein